MQLDRTPAAAGQAPQVNDTKWNEYCPARCQIVWSSPDDGVACYLSCTKHMGTAVLIAPHCQHDTDNRVVTAAPRLLQLPAPQQTPAPGSYTLPSDLFITVCSTSAAEEETGPRHCRLAHHPAVGRGASKYRSVADNPSCTSTSDI